jgi:hypothetical protein
MVGWRERVDLPGIGIASLVAKLDTGARSSALHVLDVQVDGDRVRFVVPVDRDATTTVTAEEELLEWRYVRDSGGHGTLRPVVNAGRKRSPWRTGPGWCTGCSWGAPPCGAVSSWTRSAHSS